jgi:hypothetical protein
VSKIKTPISTNNLDMIAHVCNPKYVQVIIRRITVQDQLLGKIERFPSKKIKQKRAWKCGSSSRVLA